MSLSGGTACDIILGREGVDFRATKDLDIVLIIELLNSAFIDRFVDFVRAAGYQHINKNTGGEQYYRFRSPRDASFPHMVELFSRRPDYLEAMGSMLAPIHVSDDAVSLSAILLDGDYYGLLRRGIVEVDGVSVLGLEQLMLFKIRAWLDLSSRKEKGERIDSRDVKKHKNDVFRLAASLDPAATLEIDGAIRADAERFMEKAMADPVDVRTLGIRGASYEDILQRIRNCYQL